MKTIPFNIKYKNELMSGEYKLQTKSGLPARVVCWDACSDFPLIVLVDFNIVAKDEDSNIGEVAYNYSPSGTLGEFKDDMDLVIVTDEPEFTKFEAKLKEIIDSFCGEDRDCGSITPAGVAYYSKQLLNLIEDNNKCTSVRFTPILRMIDYAWNALIEKPYETKKTFISYCKKLADCLNEQGYIEDCKLVSEKVGWMLGDDVAVAVQE